jgi:hypothetical protein
VFGRRDLGPVRGAKRQCMDVHDGSFVRRRDQKNLFIIIKLKP